MGNPRDEKVGAAPGANARLIASARLAASPDRADCRGGAGLR
jgi:hypothetical protein